MSSRIFYLSNAGLVVPQMPQEWLTQMFLMKSFLKVKPIWNKICNFTAQMIES